MFYQQFKDVCDTFQKLMGSAMPEWFIQYLIETRGKVQPETDRNSIKITEWKGHSFEEIEAHLHALHISLSGMLFNSILSKETGYIMAHQCGCSDCFYEGQVLIKLPPIAEIKTDYVNHLEQQKQQHKAA